MPATDDEKRLESRASAVTASLALVCGLVLLYVSFWGWQSDAVDTVDHVVKFDSTYLSSARGVLEIPTLTTRMIMRSVFWMSVLVVIVAIVGIVGSLLRHKGPVCAYVLFATCLSLVVLVSSVQTSHRRILAGPVLMRQAEKLCNTRTYIQLSTGLGCTFASHYNQSEVDSCGALCKFRVDQLKKHRGCEVLPKLCSAFDYERLEGGGCLAAALGTGMVAYKHKGSSMCSHACRTECDRDIGCDTFIHMKWSGGKEQCVVLTARATYHDPANWTHFTKGFRKVLTRLRNDSAPAENASLVGAHLEHQCFRRAKPEVLLEFMDIGLYLAVTTGVLAALLLLSTFCTCCILYNVNMSRRGLPTAFELGFMMCCPCFSQHVHRKFKEDYFRDDEKGEDSDGESEDSESDDEDCVE